MRSCLRPRPVQHALAVAHRVHRTGLAPPSGVASPQTTRRSARTCHGTAVTARPVEGGWYAVLNLLRREIRGGVGPRAARGTRRPGATPGGSYDSVDEPFVVTSLLTPESTFEEGVAAGRRFLGGNVGVRLSEDPPPGRAWARAQDARGRRRCAIAPRERQGQSPRVLLPEVPCRSRPRGSRNRASVRPFPCSRPSLVGPPCQ